MADVIKLLAPLNPPLLTRPQMDEALLAYGALQAAYLNLQLSGKARPSFEELCAALDRMGAALFSTEWIQTPDA